MDGEAVALLAAGGCAVVLVAWLLTRRPSADADPVADAINRRMQEPPRRIEPTLEAAKPTPEPEQPAARPPLFTPEILAKMPARVMFLDVETTGLHSTDRIVTLGALTLETASLANGDLALTGMHLVFDPMRKSHPQAERVHGWDDWTLRHQDLFADHAAEIRAAIEAADLLVAHNASFDMGFIDRELTLAGLTMPERPVECTMRAWRARGLSRATLSAVCAHLGVARAGEVHGAIEDAGLAMQAWVALHAPSARLSKAVYPPPSNLKPVPPRPAGPLPRRKARSARTPK